MEGDKGGLVKRDITCLFIFYFLISTWSNDICGFGWASIITGGWTDGIAWFCTIDACSTWIVVLMYQLTYVLNSIIMNNLH